jgi:hypothetical protein
MFVVCCIVVCLPPVALTGILVQVCNNEICVLLEAHAILEMVILGSVTQTCGFVFIVHLEGGLVWKHC